VTYVGKDTAAEKGLTKVDGNSVYIGVDNTTKIDANGPGRSAVRLVSKASFNDGLFIADFAHMPGGVCSTWPAL